MKRLFSCTGDRWLSADEAELITLPPCGCSFVVSRDGLLLTALGHPLESDDPRLTNTVLCGCGFEWRSEPVRAAVTRYRAWADAKAPS